MENDSDAAAGQPSVPAAADKSQGPAQRERQNRGECWFHIDRLEQKCPGMQCSIRLAATARPRSNTTAQRRLDAHERAGYRRAMSIIATIMNTSTGLPIQKMAFGRMPKPWASFTLESGELVKAERIDVGKPAPGKFVVPVSVWVTPKK